MFEATTREVAEAQKFSSGVTETDQDIAAADYPGNFCKRRCCAHPVDCRCQLATMPRTMVHFFTAFTCTLDTIEEKPTVNLEDVELWSIVLCVTSS